MATDAPWGEQALTYDAREDRRTLSRLAVQAGVLAAGDFKVTPGAGLVLNIAAGDAMVAGSHAGVSRQGLYPVGTGAADAVTVGANSSGNPRIDQVVLRIRDSAPASGTAGDAENTGKIEVVAGTATAGATLANRSGAAALPASSIRLADVLVPTGFGGPFVQNTHLRDRRPWARGAFYRAKLTGGDYSTASGAYAAIDATNIFPRIECSGAPLRVALLGRARNTAAEINFRLYQDGAFYDDSQESIATNWQSGAFVEWMIQPGAGSHVFTPYWNVSGSTATISASADVGLVVLIEELVRANAANSGA